jgi:hypothetical protein
MSTLDILKAARAKIAKAESWTKDTSARDDSGGAVPPRSRLARCWCSLGAVCAVRPPGDDDGESLAISRLESSLSALTCRRDVVEFNDAPSRLHSEVLALFDHAIADEARVTK